jgi:tRNA pseudouridine55 synthase
MTVETSNQAVAIGSAMGLLLLDKPAGVTSHDMVLAARRAYGERSIGHLGTLDPFATGLLLLLIGRATRLATFIETEPKVYDATIRFGAETDTDDSSGTVVRSTATPEAGAVLRAIVSLTGDVMQVPPAYSAKSVNGTRAYDAARRGEALDLRPVPVRVDGWVVTEQHEDWMRVTITCGGGTYVRALARDLGRATGSSAHLESLRRTRCGPFDVRDAASLQDLRTAPPALRTLIVVSASA